MFQLQLFCRCLSWLKKWMALKIWTIFKKSHQAIVNDPTLNFCPFFRPSSSSKGKITFFTSIIWCRLKILFLASSRKNIFFFHHQQTTVNHEDGENELILLFFIQRVNLWPKISPLTFLRFSESGQTTQKNLIWWNFQRSLPALCCFCFCSRSFHANYFCEVSVSWRIMIIV